MVRLAIVEDNPACVEQLRDYLRRFQQEQGECFQLTVFQDGEQLAFDYHPVYDILLMDVEMPHMDGIAAARAVREQDSEVTILFITNMAQYAIDGYSVRARSYLLKPVNYYAFAMELKDAIQTLARPRQDAILLNIDGSITKLPVGQILYVESQGHNLMIHTAKQVTRIRMSIRQMEERLQGYSFARCNVSYLVNLAHVTTVDGSCAMVGGDVLPISRQKRREFLAALTDYIGGGYA